MFELWIWGFTRDKRSYSKRYNEERIHLCCHSSRWPRLSTEKKRLSRLCAVLKEKKTFVPLSLAFSRQPPGSGAVFFYIFPSMLVHYLNIPHNIRRFYTVFTEYYILVCGILISADSFMWNLQKKDTKEITICLYLNFCFQTAPSPPPPTPTTASGKWGINFERHLAWFHTAPCTTTSNEDKLGSQTSPNETNGCSDAQRVGFLDQQWCLVQ